MTRYWRFISADPNIQAPFVTASFNRYSYVFNNPLKYMDPTGFYTFAERPDDIGDNRVNGYSDHHSEHDNGHNTEVVGHFRDEFMGIEEDLISGQVRMLYRSVWHGEHEPDEIGGRPGHHDHHSLEYKLAHPEADGIEPSYLIEDVLFAGYDWCQNGRGHIEIWFDIWSENGA